MFALAVGIILNMASSEKAIKKKSTRKWVLFIVRPAVRLSVQPTVPIYDFGSRVRKQPDGAHLRSVSQLIERQNGKASLAHQLTALSLVSV